MTLGDLTGGEVVLPAMGIGDIAKGLAIAFDGAKPHWSKEFKGERYSIVVFCHDRHCQLSDADREYLKGLGFWLPPMSAALAPAMRRAPANLDPPGSRLVHLGR